MPLVSLAWMTKCTRSPEWAPSIRPGPNASEVAAEATGKYEKLTATLVRFFDPIDSRSSTSPSPRST